MKFGLEEFDKNWVAFEEKYINELILIENESRRFITQAIEYEKDLMTFETRAKFRGMILLDNDEYNKMRAKLVNLVAKINSVRKFFFF